jgi:sugar lactone lactonase YvrE
MDDSESESSGRFYVFDRGTITAAGPTGISITNGPAVNADSSLIYFTDTVGQKITVADLTENGAGEARPFVDTAAHFPKAYPDGPHVDAEGYVWSGLFHGSKAVRFAPDGSLDRAVSLPAQNITKLCLGGPDMRTAFVTSARKGMDQTKIIDEPRNGALLSFQTPIPGFAAPLVRLA